MKANDMKNVAKEIVTNVNNMLASNASNASENVWKNISNVKNETKNENTENVIKAIDAIKNAVAKIRKETLTLRNICRVIRDMLQDNDATINAIAAKYGIKENSNNKQISAAAKAMEKNIPYYIATKILNTTECGETIINEKITLAKLDYIATENDIEIYKCKESTNIFEVLEAILLNDNETHIELKPNKYYNENLQEVEKPKLVKKSKEEVKLDRLYKSINENSMKDILRAVSAKTENKEILELLTKAIELSK